MIGSPRIAAIALLPAILAGCAGVNPADKQSSAYFEGAIKANGLTRDAPAVVAPVVPAAPIVATAPPEAPIVATVPVGITDVAPLAPPPPAPMPLAPPGEPALPAAPPGPVPGDVAPPPAGAPELGVAPPPAAGDVDAVPEGVVTPAPPPPNLPPRYEVVAQRTNDRPDKLVTYYVVIDPVDPHVDAFKMAVKQVVAMLAANNGGPMFSVYIWDQLSAAQTEVSYLSNPDLFSQEVLDAREVFNSQHLVATYAGGLSSASQPPSYLLFWYPDSRAENPPFGQWVSAEVWKP